MDQDFKKEQDFDSQRYIGSSDQNLCSFQNWEDSLQIKNNRQSLQEQQNDRDLNILFKGFKNKEIQRISIEDQFLEQQRRNSKTSSHSQNTIQTDNSNSQKKIRQVQAKVFRQSVSQFNNQQQNVQSPRNSSNKSINIEENKSRGKFKRGAQNSGETLQVAKSSQIYPEILLNNKDTKMDQTRGANILNVYRDMKIKMRMRNFLNTLYSRMKKKLNKTHFDLIGDKSYWNEEHFLRLNQRHSSYFTKIGNLFNNNLNEDYQLNEDEFSSQNQGILTNFLICVLKNKTCSWIIKNFRQIPIINPSSYWKLMWDCLISLSVLVLTFCLSIHISFEKQLQQLLEPPIQHILVLILWIDILVNFNTGFYEKGILSFDRLQVFKQWLSKQIVWDFLSLIPVTITAYSEIQQDQESSQEYFQTGFYKLSICFFAYKLFSLDKFLRRIDDSFPTSENLGYIMAFSKLIVIILVTTHIFSSIWIILGKFEQRAGIDNWIYEYHFESLNWESLYIKSFYFNMVTMVTVGYGDISPKSDLEQILCILTMIMTCGLFAFTINSMDQILRNMYQQEQDIKRNMKIINKFMRKKQISSSLQYQIRQYLEYVWRESSEETEQESLVIEQLSDILREKLMVESNKLVLIDSPFFKENFSQKLILKTVGLIQEYKSTPEEVLVKKDDLDDCSIYFIEKGKVECFLQEKEGEAIQTIRVYQKGESFGMVSFFSGQKRHFSIRSTEFTNLLLVRRKDFLNLLQDFPEDYEKFCQIKDKILNYSNYEQIKQKCYSCGKEDHRVDECPFIHYKPVLQRIYARYNFSQPHLLRKKNDKRAKGDKKLQFKTLGQINNLVEKLETFHQDYEKVLDHYEVANELDKYDDITIYESESENPHQKSYSSDHSSSYTDEEHIYSGKNILLLKKDSKNDVIEEEESGTGSEENSKKINSKKTIPIDNESLKEFNEESKSYKNSELEKLKKNNSQNQFDNFNENENSSSFSGSLKQISHQNLRRISNTSHPQNIPHQSFQDTEDTFVKVQQEITCFPQEQNYFNQDNNPNNNFLNINLQSLDYIQDLDQPEVVILTEEDWIQREKQNQNNKIVYSNCYLQQILEQEKEYEKNQAVKIQFQQMNSEQEIDIYKSEDRQLEDNHNQKDNYSSKVSTPKFQDIRRQGKLGTINSSGLNDQEWIIQEKLKSIQEENTSVHNKQQNQKQKLRRIKSGVQNQAQTIQNKTTEYKPHKSLVMKNQDIDEEKEQNQNISSRKASRKQSQVQFLEDKEENVNEQKFKRSKSKKFSKISIPKKKENNTEVQQSQQSPLTNQKEIQNKKLANVRKSVFIRKQSIMDNNFRRESILNHFQNQNQQEQQPSSHSPRQNYINSRNSIQNFPNQLHGLLGSQAAQKNIERRQSVAYKLNRPSIFIDSSSQQQQIMGNNNLQNQFNQNNEFIRNSFRKSSINSTNLNNAQNTNRQSISKLNPMLQDDQFQIFLVNEPFISSFYSYGEFEYLKEFQYYFPDNNYENVLERYQKYKEKIQKLEKIKADNENEKEKEKKKKINQIQNIRTRKSTLETFKINSFQKIKLPHSSQIINIQKKNTYSNEIQLGHQNQEIFKYTKNYKTQINLNSLQHIKNDSNQLKNIDLQSPEDSQSENTND